jgi:hypothetical protein
MKTVNKKTPTASLKKAVKADRVQTRRAQVFSKALRGLIKGPATLSAKEGFGE